MNVLWLNPIFNPVFNWIARHSFLKVKCQKCEFLFCEGQNHIFYFQNLQKIRLKLVKRIMQ